MAHYLGRLRAATAATALSHLRQWPRNKLVITAPLMPISGLIRPALNLNSSQLTSLPSSGHTHAINFSAATKLAAHFERRIYFAAQTKMGRFYDRVKNVYCVCVCVCLRRECVFVRVF
jgi:hypothetical protein